MKRGRALVWSVAAFCAGVIAPSAMAQLRVANWNISNYSGGRTADLQTSMYTSFNGEAMAPDVIICQEFLSQAAADSFLTILNTAPGGPGDWMAAPFQNGNDTDNAMFYRTSRVDFLGMTVIQVGALPPAPPRDVNRYDVRLKDYAAPEAVVAIYSAHMKAGSSADDQARRLIEAQNIRNNAETLPVGWNFMLGGDFNIQSSSQAAYQELIGSQSNNDGRFWDPIFTPGSWNNSGTYRFVHTQDPIGAGGVDDRHDQLLTSFSLVDGVGLDYIGDAAIPYSTVTWDDPNHSYRCWGNDGTSFNTTLTVAGNAMVGPTIAQALINVANGAGHLPVFLDLRVPGKVGAPVLVDVGNVNQNDVVDAMVPVSNAGDIALWSVDGIADLNYTLVGSVGITIAGGPFVAAAGAGSTIHLAGIDTSALGPINKSVAVLSDDIDEPVFIVQIVGAVVAQVCPGDADGNSAVDLGDVNTVLFNFGSVVTPGTNGDVDGNGTVDLGDLNLVLFNFGNVC